jgi:catechol 2,3-dioxygenase-like lactoylglutathione lyase family enzyme
MSTEPEPARPPRLRLTNTVLGSREPRALGRFYSRLLGWPIRTDEPDWVTLQTPDDGPGLAFQLETEHVRPVWPSGPGDQQMMAHLDIQVDDLAPATAFALGCGATLADFQPQQDVRVLLDPAGHPFCLWIEA